jgi:hypothetical protein
MSEKEKEVKEIHFQNVQFGFEYGAAKVTRLFSDEKKGVVIIEVATPKHKEGIQVYVTRTGKVRIASKSGEWKLNTKDK